MNKNGGEKWRRTYHSIQISACFVLSSELLLTLLPAFEREVLLKDMDFCG